MKRKLSVLVLFALTACAVIGTGCTSMQITGENQGNFGEHVRTPVKDFESMGLVFTENKIMSSLTGTGQGQIFTYQALLKEAQKLGADAIINVAIDIKTSSTGGIIEETWYGSALAIKYTEILKQTGTVTVTTDKGTTTTETSSVYFNDGGGSGGGGGENTNVSGRVGRQNNSRQNWGIRQ